jgi:pilus assembly protein CpaC
MSLFRPLLGAVLASAALLLSGAEAWAQASNTLKVELGGSAPVSRRLSLPKGKSAIIDLPVDARDVLVSNPKVADAVLRTPRRLFVLGVGSGETDAVFFDGAGRQILSLNIRVDQPVSAVEDTIHAVAPDANVKVEAVNDSLVLTGTVADTAESDRIQRVAASFVAKPELVINTLSIRSPEQVMIKVRVVEMQRNLIKQLGFNTSALLGQVGMSQISLANAAQYAVNGGILGGLSGGYSLDTTQQPEMIVPCAQGVSGTCSEVVHSTTFPYTNSQGNTAWANNGNTATTQTTAGSPGLNKAGATIQAFEQAGLVRSLAEPTLTAVSGESAKFLAGGEFPVPAGVDQNGNVTVAFKSYGVGLGFTPVVLSAGRISMKISTEVSELSSIGSQKFNNSLTIPGLTVRRAETTVEMPSGGALMIAGLLKEETQEDVDSVPGLASVPVLGSLFRSRDYLSGETELVVIVETYLAKPGAPNQFQTPVDGLEVASDMDTVLLGRLNKAYKGDRAPPAPAWQGPVGYVIE